MNVSYRWYYTLVVALCMLCEMLMMNSYLFLSWESLPKSLPWFLLCEGSTEVSDLLVSLFVANKTPKWSAGELLFSHTFPGSLDLSHVTHII